MAILKIVKFPNAVLKTRCAEVTVFDADLGKFAEDLFDTMYAAPGVGLAANQVGISKRIAVIDIDYKMDEDESTNLKTPIDQNRRVIVNPVILKRSGEIPFSEGCLSVPGFSEEVKRTEKLTLEYQDLKGHKHKLEAEGLLAVCIQHEVDHLDGKLFIDRLSMAKRELIKSRIKKGTV